MLFESLRDWQSRRRRFSEEWEFHRDQMAAELRASGLRQSEVRKIVRRRLGRKSRWRRAALKEIGGDWRALLRCYRPSRCPSPWVAPAWLALALVILFVCNPLRWQMLSSFISEPGDYVPIRKMLVIPADFARLIWGTLLISAAMWLARTGRGLRISLYALLLLVLLAALGVFLWIAAIQASIAIKWPSDLLEGSILLGFFFAYFWASLLTAKRWRADVASRCPVCLKRLRFAMTRGRSCDVLVHPLELESICLEGHGALREEDRKSVV